MGSTKIKERPSGATIDGQEYRDEGCEISPSCLRCPLPRCKYDEPHFARAQRRRQRDNLVVNARIREGLTVAEVARRFALSHRTVFRILRRNGYGRTKSAPTGISQRFPAAASIR